MVKCYRCNGRTKFYSSCLGYEALKCLKCGHEYFETSKEEYLKNKEEYLRRVKK
jgi:hypothetical protein